MTTDDLRQEFEEMRTTSYEEPIVISDEEAEILFDWFLSKLTAAKREERERIGDLLGKALSGETLSGMTLHKLRQIFVLTSESEGK